jgi:hypothetical protein
VATIRFDKLGVVGLHLWAIHSRDSNEDILWVTTRNEDIRLAATKAKPLIKTKWSTKHIEKIVYEGTIDA